MLNRSQSPPAYHNSSLSLSSFAYSNAIAGGNNATGIMPSASDEILKLRKEVSNPLF